MQPVVMLVIAGVAMFSVIGGVSLLSHYYTLNGIKSRTVGDGQHGTARFATKKAALPHGGHGQLQRLSAAVEPQGQKAVVSGHRA